MFTAAGQDKRAFSALLTQWQKLSKQRAFQATNNSGLATLKTEIKLLSLQAIQRQTSDINYERLFEAFTAQSYQVFLKAAPDWKAVLIDLLCKTSYKSGKAQQYREALVFASLAREMDSSCELAESLTRLGLIYIEFLIADDTEVRAEKARLILELDPDYGNIRQDSKKLISQSKYPSFSSAARSSHRLPDQRYGQGRQAPPPDFSNRQRFNAPAFGSANRSQKWNYIFAAITVVCVVLMLTWVILALPGATQ